MKYSKLYKASQLKEHVHNTRNMLWRIEKNTTAPEIEFLKHPSSVTTNEGGNASFCVRVRSTSEEKPVIQWTVAGDPVVPSEKYRIEESGDVNILHIVGVSRSDAGLIECRARTAPQSQSIDNDRRECGSDAAAARLAIIDDDRHAPASNRCAPPSLGDDDTRSAAGGLGRGSADDHGRRDSGASMDAEAATAAMMLRGPQDTTALVGDRVLLKATYLGQPEPTVRWTRAGKELKNDERTSITSGDGVSCLLLQDITADDSGKYDVSVENMFGSDCNYASVSVEGPADPPSGTPCLTAAGDTVTVTWSSAPYDGGRAVSGYAVEHSLLGSDIWTTAVEECHSLSHVVRGLQPGGRYVFRVRALNAHGSSRPSLESDVVQLEEQNESGMFEPRIVVVEPGPEFRSRYEVLEELGKGRFGVVHKVVDKKKNQKLAAKFIKCRTSKDRDKVQDEIDIMNLLRHQKLLQLAAAFDNPREMVMIMEYISGGELFERVVADDFTLTEKDCILFMRQICEGVAYMHSQNIVHLDLKPENIMCHTRTSHEIKIIDFGLAQKINPKEPVRVLFGTPEFIPPEIINYEPIGVESDMWSIGVICYVLLSGLSPFMGDNDSETFANITRADYDFEDEAFNTISQNARDFIGALLVKRKEERMSAEQCLKHVWLDPETHQETVVLCTDKLKKFIIRRKWQKTGNAIRALGRMATLSASRRNSANSSPNTPRPSITGTTLPRMSSLNEENAALNTSFDIINASKDDLEKTCRDIESFISQNGARNLSTTKSVEDVRTPTNKTARTRACSERSDSGISDCFTHPTSSSCTSTPLLGRKFRINEEVEDAEEEKIFSTSTTLVLSRNNSFNGGRKGYKVLRSDSTDDIDDQREFLNGKKPPIGLSLRLCDKIETFSNASKAKSVTASDSLKRLPIYTSRTVAGTIRKLNTTPTTLDKSLVHDITKKHSFSENNDNDDSRSDITPNGNKHASRVERILEKLSINDNVISSGRTTVTPVRCRSPSPSILRKAQAVAAKNDSFHNGHDVMDTPPKFNSIKISCPPSPLVDRKDKPKSESFQKAAAFWNSPKT